MEAVKAGTSAQVASFTSLVALSRDTRASYLHEHLLRQTDPLTPTYNLDLQHPGQTVPLDTHPQHARQILSLDSRPLAHTT